MYFLLSPAKNLDETTALPDFVPTDFHTQLSQPALMSQACELMKALKPLEPTDLSTLMGISDKLAQVNAVRNQLWAWYDDKPFSLNNENPAKPAIYLFNGDVYTGLDAYTLDKQQIAYLNQHLGILSGLYGLLKPLDLIQPYRLEMGTKLKTAKGDNLYQFWGNAITDLINQQMAKNGQKVLINLASTEYVKAINAKKINADIITPRFEDGKNGSYKVVSFYAKQARGLMVRYACQYHITQVEALKNFDLGGYHFVETASNHSEWVFRREHD